MPMSTDHMLEAVLRSVGAGLVLSGGEAEAPPLSTEDGMAALLNGLKSGMSEPAHGGGGTRPVNIGCLIRASLTHAVRSGSSGVGATRA